MKKTLFEFAVPICVIAFLFFLLIWFVSCTPQKRLSNLISNNPELMKRDSILITDSILIKGKHAEFTFDTSIYNYHYITNGIEMDFKKDKGNYTINAKTKDSIVPVNYYSYTNNYITNTQYTFKEKVLIVLTGIGIIAIILLFIFLIIKFIK